MFEQKEQKQVEPVPVEEHTQHVFPINMPFSKQLDLKVASLRIGNISKE